MSIKCYTHSKILKVVLFFASIAAYYYVDGAFAVYDTMGCDNCMNNGYVTCRSTFNQSITYCCNPKDPFVANCTALPGNVN